MKRLFFVCIIICFTAQLADAQLWKLRRWETEFGLGPSFFSPNIGGFSIGDNLLGLRDISYRQTRFDVNGSLRYRLSRTVNIRFSLTYAMLHASDSRGSNEGRGFESTTSLIEPSLLGEYYFVKNKYESSYLFMKGRDLWLLFSSLDFYAFAGVGVIDYSIKENAALKNQGQPENGFTTVIPFGVGATLIYNPNINFGIELGRRYVFTDYLDGYSSKYSKANDVYYFLNFTVTYKFKSGPHGLPSLR